MSTTDEQRLREALIQQIERFAAQYPAESGIRYALERCCNYLRAEAAQQAPAPAVPAAQDERAAFEQWAEREGFRLELRGAMYRDETTDEAWRGWKARAPAADPDNMDYDTDYPGAPAVPAAQDERLQRAAQAVTQQACALPSLVVDGADPTTAGVDWDLIRELRVALALALATRTNEGTK